MALGLVSLGLVLAGWSAVAAAPEPSAYRQAVEATYNLLVTARAPDAGTARSAGAILEAGTGHTQPEIITALERNPPDFKEATDRLHALLDALDRPASTADPAVAQQRLHTVLSMHRYDPLHRQPSLLDRFFQWITDRLRDLLRFLLGGGGGTLVPAWVFYVLGVAVVAAVAVVVFRATRGRSRRAIIAGRPAGPRAPADYFAEADQLAAQGDRVGAIRALCAGVAATIAGERTWEGSPLTVREIFLHAPDPERLRPLLVPFEAAVYGGREVDVKTYERALLAAAPFRHPAELAA